MENLILPFLQSCILFFVRFYKGMKEAEEKRQMAELNIILHKSMRYVKDPFKDEPKNIV